MIQLQLKSEQYSGMMFAGHFFFNKPVYNGYTPTVAPYSSIFYFSHAITDADCEFPLHPHEGFEIMTFILDGVVQHFDTETKVWTELNAGDFQIIYAGSGLKHSEKLMQGSRTFQIWFDPNFREALGAVPAYTDYHSKDFPVITAGQIQTKQLVGGVSNAQFKTEGLNIKRIRIENSTTLDYNLSPDKAYTIYLLEGIVQIGDSVLNPNDAIRVWEENTLQIKANEESELFIVELPLQPSYKPIWL